MHGFCSTGTASGSISGLTFISLLVLLSWKHPIPRNVSFYSLSNASMSSGGFTDLILSSLVSLSVSSGSILIIPSLISVFLLRSAGVQESPFFPQSLRTCFLLLESCFELLYEIHLKLLDQIGESSVCLCLDLVL